MLLLDALEELDQRELVAGRCEPHPSPARQMRMMLAAHREEGLGFDLAWRKAWRRIKWPWDTTHRRQWKATLEESKGTWEECYDRVPEGARNQRIFSTLERG